MELMAMLPALLGTAGGAMNMLGGSPASKVQPSMNPLQQSAMMFSPAINMGLGAVGGAPNIYADTLPQFGGIANNLMNNPGSAGMIGGANAAAGMGADVSNNMMGLGNFLANMGTSLTPWAGQILNQGFDPQNALRDRTQQQLLETTRAGQAARGLGNSPFGAGLENKAMSDFGIDWQNNLLNRMTTGAQGAGLLLDQAGRDITGGASLMGQAPQMMSQSSMLPYMAHNTIGQGQLGALQQYGQQGMAATQQPQQQLQDFYQLLGLGNAGANVGNNMFGNQLTQANQGFQQNQIMGANMGNSLAGLGKAFSGSGGSGGSGNAFFPSASFMSSGMGWG